VALIRESLMVTGFVVAMMLLVECAQLGSSGRLAGMIRGGGVRQYVIAGLVGVVPLAVWERSPWWLFTRTGWRVSAHW
jgi:hypothetical protein